MIACPSRHRAVLNTAWGKFKVRMDIQYWSVLKPIRSDTVKYNTYSAANFKTALQEKFVEVSYYPCLVS